MEPFEYISFTGLCYRSCILIMELIWCRLYYKGLRPDKNWCMLSLKFPRQKIVKGDFLKRDGDFRACIRCLGYKNDNFFPVQIQMHQTLKFKFAFFSMEGGSQKKNRNGKWTLDLTGQKSCCEKIYRQTNPYRIKSLTHVLLYDRMFNFKVISSFRIVRAIEFFWQYKCEAYSS